MEIFGYPIENTSFYKSILKPEYAGMFIQSSDMIQYHPSVQRLEKMKFFLDEIDEYPINKDILRKYESE